MTFLLDSALGEFITIMVVSMATMAVVVFFATGLCYTMAFLTKRLDKRLEKD